MEKVNKMTQIDTSKWGKFRVGDLFEIKPTKSYKMRNADLLDGGNTPVVVNSAFNNGIGGFTTQEPTEKGGIITFSSTVDANTIFYQEKPFAGYSNVQGVYPVGEWANEWDKYSLLFFASCFKSTALRYGFDYSNKFRRDVALELKVLLPQTPDHTPDFDYMEDYMKEITKLAAKKVEKLKEEKTKYKIDTKGWKEFRIGDLFETFHGEKLKKSDRIEGSTPFVTARSENQGVADYIVTEKKYSNAITINVFGNCFYHDGTLFGDSSIYFLISNNISKYSKLFITTIINSTLKEKYSFSHQFRQKDLDTLTINLPSTTDNFPDWQFMEDYMKEITEKAKNKIKEVKNYVEND